MKSKTYQAKIEQQNLPISDVQIERLEKIISEGKSFWIFKRMAAWLTIFLFMFGAIASFYPAILTLESKFVGVSIGMFFTFFINSWLDWSKMEKKFKSKSE